ncbi:type II toxin-antitoxin system ParD family antitoxin [Rhizobium rhizogenes]|jgi:antitoxin ParD1/3/4|uniref:type II toxin-antitoxin system ParD family antitoxin n=1 Tax=Rhizobium rhizogenes TaxID=359 RepID=UPI0006483B9F|nr:type II toxin-antitoxin system ParD family antitoxin [Rhizobium rhizogenes]
MTKHVSVEIDEQMDAFIGEQISLGHFTSLDEFVNAALTHLRHRIEIEAIEAAIKEGEASGEPEEFDFDAFLAERHEKYLKQ